MAYKQSIKDFLRLYGNRRLGVILLLGFASGLPLALSASTLFVWLAESEVDLTVIGLFAAVGTPYALKFFWAPLVDGLNIPIMCRLFGRRRGWLFTAQAALAASLLLLGMSSPASDPWMTAVFAFCVAACSATQDIVIDAYRIERLTPEEQGAGAAMAVLGYRIGMITSGAGALFLATAWGWFITYAIMAALLVVGALAALWGGEPETVASPQSPVARKEKAADWMRAHVIAPFADFMQRPQWLALLLFILLYKFADAFMGVMTNPFLIKVGFSKDEIATVVKFYGFIATIAGSFIGGWMVARIGMWRSLWICGIAHGLTNLMFVLQARVGHDVGLLALSISLENITGGMGMAAFVAFISSLTRVQFTATQYALLSSFSAFGRTWLSTPAGEVAKILGWEAFFLFASALALPGIILLYFLNKNQFVYNSANSS